MLLYWLAGIRRYSTGTDTVPFCASRWEGIVMTVPTGVTQTGAPNSGSFLQRPVRHGAGQLEPQGHCVSRLHRRP